MSNGGMSQEEIDKLMNGMSEGNVEPDNVETVINEESKENSGGPGMSQEEIDKLLNNNVENVEKSQIDLIDEEKKRREEGLSLTQEEKDVIGELANISFGSASTALSSLLNQRVSITTPIIEVVTENEFSEGETQHVVLNVNYVKGLTMQNVLVIKKEVAMYISDMMMMGNGEIDTARDLTDMELSAVQEAMNQMMGMAATSMSEVFQKLVDISPPSIKLMDIPNIINDIKEDKKKVVRISFRLEIGDKIKSNLYQIVSINNAKEMAKQLLEIMNPVSVEGSSDIENSDVEVQEVRNVNSNDGKQKDETKLSPLIKDVAVKLELVYGRTKSTLKEFLTLEQNHVIELAEEMNEPLKLYANGILVAEGELLNVDGYYGLKVHKVY